MVSHHEAVIDNVGVPRKKSINHYKDHQGRIVTNPLSFDPSTIVRIYLDDVIIQQYETILVILSKIGLLEDSRTRTSTQ